MPGHICYHCKQWVDAGEAHDCWTTTEAALTADLADDLREAWDRLRETAAEFGEQRIYASHSSIMFSRRSCYFFVRPKRSFLEVNVFLGRTVQAPQVRKIIQSSATKAVHVIQIRHRDEVEPPITDWLEEAYHYVEVAPARIASRADTKGDTKGDTKDTKRSTKDTKRSTKGTKRSTKGTKGGTKGTTRSTKGTKGRTKGTKGATRSTKSTKGVATNARGAAKKAARKARLKQVGKIAAKRR